MYVHVLGLLKQTVTNWAKQQEFVLYLFWRPKVPNRGISRAVLLLEAV